MEFDTFKMTVASIKAKTPSTVGTILTGLIEPKAQFENVKKWIGAAEYIRVHSAQRGQEDGGLRFIRPKSQIPTLRECIADYAMQIPGGASFAVISPDVVIQKDLTELFQYAKDFKYETWAAGLYAFSGDQIVPTVAPKAFFMTGSVLPYLLQEVPETLNFSSETWAVWLDEWLGRTLMRPRYFHPNQLKLVKFPEGNGPVLNAYDIPPAPSVLVEQQNTLEPKETALEAPAKKKPGRPKKA